MPSETEDPGTRVRVLLDRLGCLLFEELSRQERDEHQQAQFAASQGWVSVPDAERAEWRRRVRETIAGQLPKPKRRWFGWRWLGRLFSRPRTRVPELPSAWPCVQASRAPPSVERQEVPSE